MACEHLHHIRFPKATAEGCEECLRLGMGWVHLRLCVACGHVGCCDNSPGRHATGHFKSTGHPVIASYERGENWAWCYAHEESVVLPKSAR